ncbi:MAG: putative spermidine/putrescine transport system substrate-binding protein, partial [Rhodospirillaceae bacterium]|nr:putative spermidine/putrescine transport system substrate-binding protein [Rhodospirillaceae bacterium]
DLWVIPKGGNAELGNKFVAYLTQPEKQAKFATCIGYTPAWKDAYPLLPKDQKFTVNPDSMANLVSWNGAYWKDNAKPVMDKFNEWLTK